MPLFYEVVKSDSRVSPPVVKVLSSLEKLKERMTPEERKDMTENDIVNGLVRIAKRSFVMDAEFSTSRAIVDNVKLLIQSEIDERMLDIKTLCDEVATVSGQMSELRATIDLMAEKQKDCMDEYYALIRGSNSSDDESEPKPEPEYDNWDFYERTAFWACVLIVPVLLGVSIMLASNTNHAYVSSRLL
jgi:hypothetical protein